MEKIVAEFGPFKAVRVKAQVLAIYRGERFECNLRPADPDYKNPVRRFAKAIRAEAEAKAERAERVAAGRARKMAVVAAIKAEADRQPQFQF